MLHLLANWTPCLNPMCVRFGSKALLADVSFSCNRKWLIVFLPFFRTLLLPDNFLDSVSFLFILHKLTHLIGLVSEICHSCCLLQRGQRKPESWWTSPGNDWTQTVAIQTARTHPVARQRQICRSWHQSQSKWWRSCCTDLRYQTSYLQGIGCLLPEM